MFDHRRCCGRTSCAKPDAATRISGGDPVQAHLRVRALLAVNCRGAADWRRARFVSAVWAFGCCPGASCDPPRSCRGHLYCSTPVHQPVRRCRSGVLVRRFDGQRLRLRSPKSRGCALSRAPLPSSSRVRVKTSKRSPGNCARSHVIEGSVRRAGDRLRVTAQLIEASGGAHLWSGDL
jgi:hypothetical protein